jgi:hypothetical protein
MMQVAAACGFCRQESFRGFLWLGKKLGYGANGGSCDTYACEVVCDGVATGRYKMSSTRGHASGCCTMYISEMAGGLS